MRTLVNNGELQQWKTLANDAIIETFGTDCPEQRLAVALERAVEEIECIADECDHCKTCPTHGNHEDDSIPINADEIVRIHGQLKKAIQAFKDLHVKFAEALAESDVDGLVEELATQIEEAEDYVDELEGEIMP